MTEPATPFWQGYRRSDDVHVALIHALSDFLRARPTQRFGQALANLDLQGRDPWSVWDEDWIKLLKGESLGS